jgi:hypothetical protein
MVAGAMHLIALVDSQVGSLAGELDDCMCGIKSNVTATSLKRMSHHLLPVFEDPIVMAPIVSEHSDLR